MIQLIAKKLIPNYEDSSDAVVRQKYGTLLGGMGIFFNTILFAAKLIAGIVSGSVAIVADALNNLSDAGSSIITMVGFKMSGQKPDPDHPFGHGRIEYLTGLIVSLLIILMGVELFKTSFAKVIHPEALICSAPTVIILSVSILIKLYMFSYNRKCAERFSSAAMNATAMDSLSDSIATAVVLLATLLSQYMGLKVDGICGLIISGLILFAGFNSARDTIAPLLGTKPSKEFVEQLEKFVNSYDKNIVGMHDLVIHDYGPGRQMITFHAEVPASADIMEIHDVIDNMEHRIYEVLGAQATIHMDPVVVDDARNDRMKRLTYLIVKSVDERLSIHDFRMVAGPTHTNLIFDVLMPYEVPYSEEELKKLIWDKIVELPGRHYAVIDIDRPYC